MTLPENRFFNLGFRTSLDRDNFLIISFFRLTQIIAIPFIILGFILAIPIDGVKTGIGEFSKFIDFIIDYRS